MLALFAQVQPPPPAGDPLGGWGTLGVQGVVCMLLVYIITQLIPKALKDTREERERRDASFTLAIEKLNDKFNERNNIISQAIHEQTRLTNGALADQTKAIVCELKLNATLTEKTLQAVCHAKENNRNVP